MPSDTSIVPSEPSESGLNKLKNNVYSTEALMVRDNCMIKRMIAFSESGLRNNAKEYHLFD